MFESYFRDEISYSHSFSNLYILSTGFMTLEKLDLINKIFNEDSKKLDEIKNDVSETNKILTEIKNGFVKFVVGISTILIAMAVFLGINLFSKDNYSPMMIYSAFVCYGISEFIIYYLSKEGYILSSNKIGYEIVNLFIVPVFITVSCFLIIFLNIGINKEILLSLTFNLICGDIAGLLLKHVQYSLKDC